MQSTAARQSLRRHDPAGTRELILREAMRLIARDGVDDLRVKDLADAVGIRAPSVYKHFVNRDAIIGAVAQSMDADLARFLRPDPSLGPVAWLDAWARSLAWFCASRPAFVVLMLRDMASPGGLEAVAATLGPPAEVFNRPPLQALDEEFRAVCAKGVEQGLFRPVSPGSLAAMLLGAALAVVAWPFDGRPYCELGAADLMRLQDDLSATARALTQPTRSQH